MLALASGIARAGELDKVALFYRANRHMTSGRFYFGRFVLDPHNRQLTRDDVPVELNARYLDALALLVRERGQLVSKDRFLREVWQGVPVTDEALTQCIRTLRKHLGDDASNPRYIDTVVKHGYRFIAPVEYGHAQPEAEPVIAQTVSTNAWTRGVQLGGMGTVGAAVAGAVGGSVYGLVAASQPLEAGTGATSALTVVFCLTVAMSLIGGAGVSFGIALAAVLAPHRPLWRVAGGAAGGFLIGAVVKLLSLDAFSLLFGQSLSGITGAPEGAILGGAVGLGASLAARAQTGRGPWRHISGAAVVGGAAGILISVLGGRLMWGSLILLGEHFPSSRLRFTQVWKTFGDHDLSAIGLSITSAFEGALFGACIVGGLILRAEVPREKRGL